MSLWERPRKLDLSPGLPGSRAQTLRSPALPLTASGAPPPLPPGLCFSARRNKLSLPVEIHTHSPTKLSEGRRMARKGEQLWEQEALQENGRTDGEMEPRSPSVSDSRGPGGPPFPPPALAAQRDGAGG